MRWECHRSRSGRAVTPPVVRTHRGRETVHANPSEQRQQLPALRDPMLQHPITPGHSHVPGGRLSMPQRRMRLHLRRQHHPRPRAHRVESAQPDRDYPGAHARALIGCRHPPIVSLGADTSFRRQAAIAPVQCGYFYARTPSVASPPLWWESRNRKAGACPEQVSAPTASGEALTGFPGGASAMPIQEAS